MGIFKRRRGYESRLIGKALDPYHYPVDDDGNPIPTSSVRSTSNTGGEQRAQREEMPDPSRDDQGADVPAGAGSDEHVVVDLTAEDANEVLQPPNDSVAAHFARIAQPPRDTSEQTSGAHAHDTTQGS